MKITKEQYLQIANRLQELETQINGGKGSGNFGHAGRPGEVGGSAPEGSGGVSAKDAKAAEKKAQKAYDDYTDKHGFDQSEEAHELYKKYTDAKKATRLAEQKELYAKTPKAKELVDGEQELHDIVDKYGKYETSTKAGQIITKLDDFSQTFEADTEGFYSRKNKDLTKKVLDHTQELQKIAKDIASDKKLSKSDKATLIDSVAALYSTLGSSIYSGGKFRADDDFTSGKTWTRLDSSDSLKGAAKQYAKKLRDLGDSTYDIYKAKEGGGKYYSWSDLLDKNSLHDRLESRLESIDLLLNGGKGSGNFGHSGRPGEVGGSAPEGASGGNTSSKTEEKDPEIEAIDEYEKKQIDWVKRQEKAGYVTKEKAQEHIKDIKRKMAKSRTLKSVKPGDTLEITPKDNLPNFDRKIKVQEVGEDYFRYGITQYSDGRDYPFWAIKDLKIVKKKKNELSDIQKKFHDTLANIDRVLNGGKGSGNFGHAGRPGEIGGSAKESGGFGSAENRKRGEARYKNQKVAHREMSYVMRAAHNGGQVSLESVADEPSIKEAFERAKFDKTTLEEHKGDKKREKLQQELENRLLSKENGAFSGKDRDGEHFDGEVENGKEAFIVIGRPAGGKSSVFANPLSQNYKARIIDADLVKTWLPEFDDGFGAGRTQDESAMIMERALKKATDKGENVVIPKIGGESVAKMAKELKDKGYKVHLKYNEVSEASSITRAISRFVEKGRWLDPKYLQSIGDKAERFYKKYAKDKDYFDDAEWLNNDVKFGQKPKKVDKVD